MTKRSLGIEEEFVAPRRTRVPIDIDEDTTPVKPRKPRDELLRNLIRAGLLCNSIRFSSEAGMYHQQPDMKGSEMTSVIWVVGYLVSKRAHRSYSTNAPNWTVGKGNPLYYDLAELNSVGNGFDKDLSLRLPMDFLARHVEAQFNRHCAATKRVFRKDKTTTPPPRQITDPSFVRLMNYIGVLFLEASSMTNCDIDSMRDIILSLLNGANPSAPSIKTIDYMIDNVLRVEKVKEWVKKKNE